MRTASQRTASQKRVRDLAQQLVNAYTKSGSLSDLNNAIARNVLDATLDGDGDGVPLADVLVSALHELLERAVKTQRIFEGRHVGTLGVKGFTQGFTQGIGTGAAMEVELAVITDPRTQKVVMDAYRNNRPLTVELNLGVDEPES